MPSAAADDNKRAESWNDSAPSLIHAIYSVAKYLHDFTALNQQSILLASKRHVSVHYVSMVVPGIAISRTLVIGHLKELRTDIGWYSSALHDSTAICLQELTGSWARHQLLHSKVVGLRAFQHVVAWK